MLKTFLIASIQNAVWVDVDGLEKGRCPFGKKHFFPTPSIQLFPDIKRKGLFGLPNMICYVSEEGHYSTMKAAFTLGIGTENCKKVKTDDRGKMVPEDLEEQIKYSIEKGEKPFYVCATAGTTVLGAYDPVHDIADICQKYGIWLHVDAAWGGSAWFSKKWKHLLNGAERADSVAWNLHKMMGAPLQMSALLTKEKGLFQECNKMGASYLFQQDKKLYDVSWDTGDKTIQCGRNNDIFKLWLIWKAKGSSGLEEQIDRAFENSRYLAQRVKEREGFTLMFEVPPEIKSRMTLAGTMLIGYQPLKNHGNFFRMIVVSPAVTKSDMDFVLDEIERLGCDL